MQARRAKWLVLITAGVVPTLLLGLGVLQYTFNHFFAGPPYLLDSGMLSSVVYRDGVSLPLRAIACSYADSFYDVYFSPLVSAISALSYIVPIDRIEWFGAIEGLLYAPFGAATYIVSSRLDPSSGPRRLPITVIAALAFAFSGIVLWMVGYPHLEAAIPAFCCVMLGAFVTGRTRMGWVFLVLAVAVRQDGGFIVVLTLAPLLFLAIRGVSLSVSRRTLLIACAVAVGSSVVGMVAQKVFFHPFPRLTQAYLGSPLYSHLSLDLLIERAHQFIEKDRPIYLPFVATVVVAVVRRDARYLLGWAAMVPWFVFGFIAVEDVKAMFFAYAAGPFIVAVFWVHVYGAHLAQRRMSAIAHEMMFALVCLSSTLGHVIQAPGWKSDVFRHMLVRHPYDRVAIHGVETAIRTHGTELGRLRVDYAVAALAIDALELVNNWSPNIEADTFAFYLEAAEPDAYARTIVANSLDSCTHVVATHILFCTRAPLSPAVFDVETEEFPAVFAFAHFGHRDRYGENGRLVIRRHLFSWLGAIPPGSYELVVHGAGAASLDLMGGPKLPLPTIETASGRDTLRVSFEVSPNDQVAFDIATTETTGFAVASAQLRLRKPISPGE